MMTTDMPAQRQTIRSLVIGGALFVTAIIALFGIVATGVTIDTAPWLNAVILCAASLVGIGGVVTIFVAVFRVGRPVRPPAATVGKPVPIGSLVILAVLIAGLNASLAPSGLPASIDSRTFVPYVISYSVLGPSIIGGVFMLPPSRRTWRRFLIAFSVTSLVMLVGRLAAAGL